MVSAGKAVKRAIQIAAGLLLAAMIGFPVMGAWFDAHPEDQDVLDGAAAQVDPRAGKLTQARQFLGGIDKSRDEVAQRAREKADEKAFEEAERRREELRRFNAGEND